MESSINSQEDEVNVYFVRQSDCEDACTPALLCAYQACEENSLNPVWLSSEKCLKMTPNKQDVFIFDPFEGDAFKHITNGFKSTVVGPRCILSCIHRKEALPEQPVPIHNIAMRGLVLTTTGFEKDERAELQVMVERMAGIYSNNYNESVTHLIANNVGSKKYQTAVEQEKPILTKEWVWAVWNAVTSQGNDQGWGEDVQAIDERFLSFSCPVFKGMVICVSQMDQDTKASIKKIVEENGGTFSTILNKNVTTVLITPSPEGDKYIHARNWKIYCLTPDWILDSVEQRHALKMDGYHVTKCKTSTPTSDTSTDVPQPDFSMCSTMPINDVSGIHKITHIDETAMDMSILNKDMDLAEVSRGFCLASLETLDLQVAMRAGLFLDGCKIYLSGFSPIHLDKLRRVLNAGGATRFKQLTDAVSHVVLGKKDEELLSTIKAWSSRPHVVNVEWICECVKQKRPVDELPFTLNIGFDNFKSPPPLTMKKKSHPNTSLENDETHIDEEVLSHYLKRQKLNTSNNTTVDDSINVSSLPCSQSIIKIFKGKTFAVIGYSEEDMQDLVDVLQEKGGVIKPKNYHGQIDFAVAGSAEEACLNAQEIVSRDYIDECINQDSMLPVKYYHIPLQVPDDITPLQDCTITISVYSGIERSFLSNLTYMLGGRFQEVFVKRPNASRGVHKSTHLICPEATESGKYNAAIRWGVPVVVADWLLACAQSGTLESEEQFSPTASSSPNLDKKAIIKKLYEKALRINNALDITQPSDESEDMEVAPTPISKKVKALKNQIQPFCSPSEIKTPDPESFRKLYPTPGATPNRYEKSLSEMKTPETPYGSTWLPNPSPNTRKRFKRIIDAIPDPPQYEPLPNPLQDACKKFVREGQEFLKNYKIRNTPVYLRKEKKTVQEGEQNEEEMTVAADCHGPLTGVVVCTSRKLHEQQKELYKVVESLGGDRRWAYDSSVTHFIFQGRENDTTKEFRQARDDGKFIVAPDWIWMCKVEKTRIDEHLFPHTHNPKRTLSLIGGRSSPVKRKIKVSTKNSDELTQNTEENQELSSEEKKEKNNLITQEKIRVEDDEEQAKISKQLKELKELDELASNSITSCRRSGGVGRNLSLTDRMRHSPAKTMPVETQPMEVPESQTTAITWEDPQEREARLLLQQKLTKSKDTQEIINDNHKLLSKEENYNKENKSLNNSSMTTDASRDSSKSWVFMLAASGLDEDERSHLMQIVFNLGGKVSQKESQFDPSVTHVVVAGLSRSERNLGCIASGKWFLHKSYLEESSRVGYFVKEEPYAWGNPAATSLRQLQPGSTEADLAAAAWRWRQIIFKDGISDSAVSVRGPFHSFKAIIYSSKERTPAFARLIRAGGGEVIKARPPFSNVEDVTHLFWEPSNTSEKVDLAYFASQQIPCLKPIYLNHYLVNETLPDEAEFYVPEYKDIIENMSMSNQSMIKRKRK